MLPYIVCILRIVKFCEIFSCSKNKKNYYTIQDIIILLSIMNILRTVILAKSLS